MNKLPKLNLVCGTKDALREVLHFVQYKDGKFAATNAYMLAIVPGDKEWMETWKMPDEFYIHAADWNKIAGKEFLGRVVANPDREEGIEVQYKDEIDYYDKSYKGEGRPSIKFYRQPNFDPKYSGQKYPDWPVVVPKLAVAKLNRIGLDPRFLSTLCEAIGVEKDKGVSLNFSGEARAVMVYPIDQDNKNWGLLMPKMLN